MFQLVENPFPTEPQVLGTVEKSQSRVTVRNAEGKKVAFRGHGNTDLYEGNPDDVPGPTRGERMNGLCAFRAAEWAVRLLPRFWSRTRVQAYCLSCHKHIAFIEGSTDPEMRWQRGPVALAMASDHDRRTVNHQIVLLNAQNDIIARSPYDVLAHSW